MRRKDAAGVPEEGQGTPGRHRLAIRAAPVPRRSSGVRGMREMGAQAACGSRAKGRPVGTDWLIRIAPLAAWGMRALTNKIDTASRPSEQAPRSVVLTSAQGPRPGASTSRRAHHGAVYDPAWQSEELSGRFFTMRLAITKRVRSNAGSRRASGQVAVS